MKYSRTALGLLNAQYRSVLKKCFLINMGLFALGAIATPANADDGYDLNNQTVTLEGNKTITNTVDVESSGRQAAIVAAGNSGINTGDYTLTINADDATDRNYIFDTVESNTDFSFIGNMIASITGTGSTDNRGLRQNATASTATYNGSINVNVQSEDGNAIGVDIWDGSTANFEGSLTDISTKAGSASSNSLAVQTFSSDGSKVYLKADQTNLTAEGSQNAQGIIAYQGSVYVDGNANITAKNGTVSTRAININCDAGNPYDSVVSLKGNSAILNAISEEGYSSSIAVLSSGTPGTFSSAVKNLTVNSTSAEKSAQGITSQYGGTVSLTEGTNTVVNATGATGAYGVTSRDGWGVPGHFTSHGNLTSNANGAAYAYGAFVYKDSSFTADQLNATGTATGENGQGIGALISASTDVVIGSAGKTSSLKGVASGESGVGIGLYVENGTGEASLTLNGTVTAEGAYAGVVNNSGTITNEADLTIKGGMENDGNFINNAKVASDNSFYNDSTGVITNNGDLNISGVNDSAIYNKGTITSGENAKYTFANNTATEGGAINNNGGNVSISNASFSNNKATSYGGAINNNGGSTLTVDKSTFDNNVVQSDNPASMSYGGAIRNYGTATITNSEFTNNKALKAEGATGSGVKAYSSVLFNAGTATIENTVMSNNRGDYMGGVIQNAGGNLTVKNSTIENSNYIDDENSTGASVLLSNSGNTTLSDLIVRNNIAGVEGVIDFQGAAVVTFDGNNEFSGNADTAVYNWNDSNVTFKSGSSSSFSGNKALTRTTKGGAIYNAATMTFESGASVEFTDNEAVAGGAVYNDVSGVVNFKDSATFTGNTANGAKNDIYNAGTINLTAANGSVLDFALDGGIDGTGVVNVNGAGTVNLTGNVNNQTVNVTNGELALSKGAADGSNLSGSTVNVNSGATINTIDEVANNYSGKITLNNGASISLDADLNVDKKYDTYSAADGATINITKINLLSALSGSSVADRTFQIADKGTFNVSSVADSIKVYTSEAKYTLQSGTANSGQIKLVGDTSGSHGLDIAVNDTNANNRQDVIYEVTTTENFDSGDKTIKNAEFLIEGNGQTIAAGTGVNSIIVNADSSLTMNNAVLESFNGPAIQNAGEAYLDSVTIAASNAGAFKNTGYMEVKDSNVYADVDNRGILVSDPSTYSGTVTNAAGATASFEGDTFTGTAELANSGTVELIGTSTDDVVFESGAEISGDGDIILSEGTTAFNNTVNSNDIYLANGAKFSGNIIGGSLDTQNENIDTGLGSITNATSLDIDANLSGSGSADTFAGASGSKITSINILGNNYGTNESLTIAAGLTGATLDDNVQINGANYYTDVSVDASGNLVLKDKLVNTSGLYTKLGADWTGGHYILNAANYTNPADSTHLTVGQALAALDSGLGAKIAADGNFIKASSTNSVNANISALDTAIGNMSGFAAQNYAKSTTSVAANLTALDTQVKSNADNIANLAVADKGNLVDGSNITAGTIAKAKLATAVQNNLLDNATTSEGLTITDGNGTTAAKIALNLASAGGLEEDATNGLQIADLGVGTAKLAANAVTTAKIADNAVTLAKIDSSAVDTAGLARGAAGTATALATTSSVATTVANQAADATYNSSNTYAANTIGNAIKTTASDLDDLEAIVGSAQTAASGTGQFATRKIGDDINLVNAVDELGQNMVSLGAANVFTNINTFKNDGGIALQDSLGANSTRLQATANGLEVDRNVKASGFTLGSNSVTTIDVDGTGVTDATAAQNIMATAATVYEGAEKGEYTGAKVTGDTAVSHTINTALAKTNTTLNNVLTTAGTEIDSAKVDVQWNSTDSTLSTVLGNGTYASTANYVTNGSSVTAAIGALDGALGAKVTGANGNVLTANSVNANLDKIDVNMGNLTSLNTSDKTSLVNAINEVASDITVAAGTYNNITAGANVAGNLIALDNTIGDVNYADETAVAGSALKKGTASPTTVRGALDALDGAIVSSDAKVNSLGSAIGGTWSGNTFTHSDYNAANKNIANADSLTTAIGKLDTAIGKVATGTYNAISASNDVATNLQALDAAFTSGTIDAKFKDTTVNSLKVGNANAITGTATAGQLDMAGNTLLNVAQIELDNGTQSAGLKVNTSGQVETEAGFKAASLQSTGNLTVGGDATVTGALNANGNVTLGDSAADTITVNGTATFAEQIGAAKGIKIGSTNAITADASGNLDMGANDLVNIKDLTTTGNAVIGGTLNAGATTISASGAGATTALNVTATDTSASGSTTTFTVASNKASVGGDFEVTGDTDLQDTTVTGTLTISDGATNDINIVATSVNAKEYGGSAYSSHDVLGIDNDTFVDGKLSSTDSLSVFKDSDGTGTKYNEVFTVNNTGSIKSDMLKTDNTADTVTIGKDASTATDIKGNLTLNSTGAATDPYVNAIDDGTTAATSAGTNNAHTLATLASVLKSAENGDYTGDSDKNIAAGSTIKTAINALDSELGADSDYGTGTLNNGVAGTNTVKANIAAINDKLGNIPDTAVNGYDMTAAGATLVGAVNKLDTNMEGVLGGIYNTTTGAYDNSVLLNTTTPNGFETGAADLSDALKKYAENNQAATGVSYNADGSVATTYTKATTTNYAGLVANSSLKSAIEQLDGNIGTAIAGVNRSATLAAATTLAANTVNANIDALDTAIGNLNYTGGTINYALANGSATDGIKTIVANIGAATTAAKGNITSAKSVNANLDQLDESIGDRSALGSKNTAINTGTAANVAAGLKAAGDAIGDMNFGASHYVAGENDLSSAVRTLDSNLYRVETDLHEVRRDLNRGMASMAAMSALVPNPRAHGNTSLAIGTGAYSGHTAAAIGGFHYLTDNIMLNVGAAWGNSRDASYRMGVTFSW